MRLAEFITRDMEAILAEWQAFAATRLPAGSRMPAPVLLDHAQQILEAIARDVARPQTPEQQAAKAKGMAAAQAPGSETAAQTHGFLRAQSGFDIKQLTSEYRALRASVLRLWMRSCHPEAPHLEDIIRFSEAIDQAVAESVAVFSDQVEQSRNMFLGMLCHDIRTPLQAIQWTAVSLGKLNAGDKVSQAAARLTNSGARMKSLIDDLVALNRANMGPGVSITRSNVDSAVLFAEEVAEIRAAHPGCVLEFNVKGNTQGQWDGVSLQRLLGNLVVNAIKYGTKGAPVRILLNGEQDDLRFEVRNTGIPIEESQRERLFLPLERGLTAAADGGLGLGLYIAREIAKAHGGELETRTDQADTVFAVRLPRQ